MSYTVLHSLPLCSLVLQLVLQPVGHVMRYTSGVLHCVALNCVLHFVALNCTVWLRDDVYDVDISSVAVCCIHLQKSNTRDVYLVT